MSATTGDARWLFSRRMDLSVFGGSAVLSLALLFLGTWMMPALTETPPWAWVGAVLMVDVAHVWSTGFRVYFDPEELRRRPALYVGTPVIAYLALVRLYAAGSAVFWHALAYLAIFHFVRQQAGWMALYRARAGDRDLATRLIDNAAIYAATCYPLVFWHTHARSFDWFVPGDVLRVPAWVDRVAFPLYVAALSTYAVSAVYRAAVGRGASPGKHLVVASTAVCWYAGIVAFDSDYAFTVTNVFIHGIPYVALIYAYERSQQPKASQNHPTHRAGLVRIVATIWALAYIEELVWDRSVWNERSYLFGPPWSLGPALGYLIPLLAVPQVTHYVLDGFLWRGKTNPGLAALFPPSRSGSVALSRASTASLG